MGWYITARRIPTLAGAICLFVGVACGPLFAQSPKPKPSGSKAKAAAAAAAAERRKLRAIQLIDEVLAEAKLVDDLAFRAIVQVRAGDALWQADPTRSRTIFQQAWKTASDADLTAVPTSFNVGIENEGAGRESYGDDRFVRSQVLSVVARRDRALADKFIQELAAAETEGTDKTSNENNSDLPWRRLSAQAMMRLGLAREQLAAGDPARAAQFAASIIAEGPSGDLIGFLIELWGVDAAAAERLYLQMIEVVRRSRFAGPNDVLLLSTPVVSPQLMVVVDRSGALQFRPTPPTNVPVRVTPPARQAFFASAADLLLRPVPTVGPSGVTPDAVARYVAGERLLPFFDAEAPQFSAQIRLRNSSLANEIDPSSRAGFSSQIAKTTYPVNRTADPLRDQMGELGKAESAAARDMIALSLVTTAARRRIWDRAKTSAAEISDVELRRAALSFIQICQIADLTRATTDDRETELTGLTAFVRRADVPPLATSWGLAQLALTARRQKQLSLANALFTEALAYAGKTESGSTQRVAAYAMVARLMLVHDAPRAWTVITDVVHAADAVAEYRGDDDLEGIYPNGAIASDIEAFYVTSDQFRVDGLFLELAKLDFDRAADLSRSFGMRRARIDAELAVARTELNR